MSVTMPVKLAFAALLIGSIALIVPLDQAGTRRSLTGPAAQPVSPARTSLSSRSAWLTPTASEPELWHTGNDYVLRVQKARVAFPGAAADGGPAEVDAITYNGRLVGPTIRVRRGSTLKIRVINELPADEEPVFAAALEQEEPPHDFFTTNLHTHGLHVSPAGNSDNPFREIPPGGSFQYELAIPADHPSGTFWYHPHKHGAVAYQAANGLAGALIVEGDSAPGNVRDLEDVPEIAAAQERILILQQMIFQRDHDGVGWVDPEDVYHEPPRPNAYDVTAVNGMVVPTFTMQPGEVQRWRFIHAGRADGMMLRWHDELGHEISSIRFGEIAVDGLALGALWLRRDITLYPGNRSDALIKAPAQPGTYYLTSVLENELAGPDEPVFIEQRVARLIVQGPPLSMNFPKSEHLAACRPFRSIEADECTVKRNLVFEYDDKSRMFRINGIPYGGQTRLESVRLGATEEWTLTAKQPPPGSADEPHPFHIHVNPFQVVAIEKVGTGVVFQADEWRDTIAVDWSRKITIRLRFRDFAGKAVYHCHTLDHEDQGMMHAFEIVDPERPDPGTDDPSRQLVDCRLPAPSLALPTARGNTWRLSDHVGAPVVVVFFRGMRCFHCITELRKLLHDAQGLADSGAELIAVSSEPLADPAGALQWLKPPAGLNFSLLMDEPRQSFRDFGCYDDGPQHGLVIIDQQGWIRARYVGAEPFSDPQTVNDVVRQLTTSATTHEATR